MTGQNNQAIYLDGRKPLEPKNWRKFLSAAVGVVAVLVCQIARADTTSEVRALFEQFITAQNRRDMEALKNVLVDGPNFVWVMRGTALWGRDAALENLHVRCQGAFYLDPGMGEFKAIERTGDVVEVYAPAVFVPSPPRQPNQPVQQVQPVQQMPPEKFVISQTILKTLAGWRIASIITIPDEAVRNSFLRC